MAWCCSEISVCKVAVLFVAFVVKVVAEVVPWVVHVVHSHILDKIQAQTCTDVFEKLAFCIKKEKVKLNPPTVC